MLHKKDFIVPIPGMGSGASLEESFGAVDVALSEEGLQAIESALTRSAIHGNRTDEDIAKLREAN